MSARITEEQKKEAIKAYRQYGNLSLVGKMVGVCRKTLGREMDRSVAFKEEMQFAKDDYVSFFEELLDERIKKPGKDKASAILLMFKLKAEMPDKYREQIAHKHEGSVKIITGVPRPAK